MMVLNTVNYTIIKELMKEIDKIQEKHDLHKLQDGRGQTNPVQKRYASKLSLDL